MRRGNPSRSAADFFKGKAYYDTYRYNKAGSNITASVELTDVRREESKRAENEHLYEYVYTAEFKLFSTGNNGTNLLTKGNILTPEGFEGLFAGLETFAGAAYPSLGIERQFSPREVRGLIYVLQGEVEEDFCEPNSRRIKRDLVKIHFGPREL